MSVETKHNLAPVTLEKLQSLIQINLDSEKGFLEASKRIEDMNISSMFLDLSEDRANNANELQKFVSWNGENPQDGGSYIGTFHRIWLELRSTLTGGSTIAILSEVERGEDYIKRLYEEVLIETSGSAMNDVLTRQHATVVVGHNRVRDLRDTYSKERG